MAADGGGLTPEQMRERVGRGFDGIIGLEYTELSADRVRAHWTLRPELHQPFGITHGGVYCSVIESLASIAGALWRGGGGPVVGVNNNTDFLRSVSEGTLYGEATPIHRGRSQQIWLVTIVDEDDRLIARGQVRLQNLS